MSNLAITLMSVICPAYSLSRSDRIQNWRTYRKVMLARTESRGCQDVSMSALESIAELPFPRDVEAQTPTYTFGTTYMNPPLFSPISCSGHRLRMILASRLTNARLNSKPGGALSQASDETRMRQPLWGPCQTVVCSARQPHAILPGRRCLSVSSASNAEAQML